MESNRRRIETILINFFVCFQLLKTGGIRKGGYDSRNPQKNVGFCQMCVVVVLLHVDADETTNWFCVLWRS